MSRRVRIEPWPSLQPVPETTRPALPDCLRSEQAAHLVSLAVPRLCLTYD